MKRWQDRGVVEDSEDDEISLGAASPSPEPPRKRIKHDQDDVVPDPQADSIQKSSGKENAAQFEAADEPWIGPKVAITCGQKTKPKPRSRPRTPEQPSKCGYASPRVLISVENASVERSPATERYVFSGQTSISDSDSDSLPDLPPILRRPRNETRESPSSAASSPLSERDVSPPAVFPTAAATAPQPQRVDSRITMDAQAAIEHVESRDIGDQFPTSTAVAKRHFRARKPNQLNPYQYDRALYLQQCKARGVQPIRLVEQESDEEESQSQSSDSVTQSQSAPYVASSPVGASSTGARDSFDVLPASAERETSSGHRLPKRRKVEHRGRESELTASIEAQQTQREQFSIPPSPPRTGSDKSNVEEAPSGFRMPPRMTPAPLPTPQISSDLKRVEGDDESTSESSPRRSRASTLNRSRPRAPVVTVSSDSEPESDLEAKRIRREQKRIRGVLPASWLKIDFRAQKPREVPVAGTRRRPPSTSPERRPPQKGVAQRIAWRRSPADSSGFPIFSGEESESDSSVRSLARLKQRKAEAASRQLGFARQSDMDEDPMENDFIDPMLAGPARSRNAKRIRGHQPRITQAFKASRPPRTDFSEERVSRTQAPTSRRHSRPKNTSLQRTHAPRPPPVQLSIADALNDSGSEEAPLPSFVKLALRQTRRHRDRGRHSPTHKVIRLATVDETEDASSTLRAWREGTIVPRASRRSARPADNGYTPHQSPAVRAALAEISGNQRSPANVGRVNQRSDQSQSERCARQNEAPQALPSPRVLQTANEDDGNNEPPSSKAAPKKRLRPSMRPLRLRSAQLESLEHSFDQTHRSAVFERRMQCLTEHVARRTQTQENADFQLDHYLRTGGPWQATSNRRTRQTHESPAERSGTHEARQAVSFPYRPRKRQARKLNVEAREYRQPSEPLPDTAITVEDEDHSQNPPKPMLQDLGPFGTRYSSNFDIRPVKTGTFFEQSTFIGSGELHDALSLDKCDLDQERGCMRVYLKTEVLELGVWQDEVAVHFTSVAAAIGNILSDLRVASGQEDGEISCRELTEATSYLLRSIVRYFARCISFSDPIDRLACVERLVQLVESLSEMLAEHQSAVNTRTTCTRILQYSTVLAKQALQLCDHSLISMAVQMKTRTLLLVVAEHLATHAVKGELDALRAAYEHLHDAHYREVGFKDDVPALSSLIILSNTLQDTGDLAAKFWSILQTILAPENATTCSIKHLETVWYDLFTVLPALAFDSRGTIRDGHLSTSTMAMWSIPQMLLRRVFELYEASSAVRCASVNDYTRTVLSRCHYLVNAWGCWQSDLALSTIYDFFAQRNLHLLNSEENRGSPSFLGDFEAEGFLHVQPDDRSFHIFLKMLAASLKGMQAHGAPLRKIQSIVFRLTPNHARTYRKDATLVKADLEALRNHYDLLCTLYCAAPARSRPSVYLLQNLIDHSTSHREACRASVRAWAHVTVFQAASTEPVETLHTLIDWYSDMVKITVTQYRLAKSEAERDFEVAQSEAHDVDSENPIAILESTIANNQVQIAATLVDALAGLKRALQSTQTLQTAKALVEGTGFMSILELFDPAQRRLLSTMMEALAVVNAALDAESRSLSSISQTEGSEDSQEFGDLDALQAFAEDDIGVYHSQGSLASLLFAPAGHFLSNVFGADAAADDTLLTATVDAWTRIAGSASIAHDKSWHSYIDEYSPNSWNQMRDTNHKRRYTPYFLSRLVEQSYGSEDIKQAVLSAWLLSLVEREATLKFQHTLTCAVLDHWPNEPLLVNLPFALEPSSGKYHITLSQLRTRRVALISSILSNMREHYDRTVRLGRGRSSELRSIYSSMLRQLMNAMKTHYQELQTVSSAVVADAGATGAYVDFVHQIVSSLQQYTLDIGPVDRFFLDSSAFPLPAGDPTYVVGRLRSYTSKLKESQSRAQLAVFVQSVVERALIDGQQDYLIDQMSTAMTGSRMAGTQGPTLWQVISRTILPVYISHSFETPGSWIAAIPVLQACRKAVPSLLYRIDVEDCAAVKMTISTVGSVLHSISQQIAATLAQSSLLDQARALKMLGVMVTVGQASIALIAFLDRATEAGRELAAYLSVLRSQATALRERFAGTEQDDLLGLPNGLPTPDCVWQDTKSFAEKHLQETFATNWYAERGRHFVRRGNTSRELVLQLENAAVEKEGLLHAIDSFCETYDATFDHRCRQRQARRACDDILSGLDV